MARKPSKALLAAFDLTKEDYAAIVAECADGQLTMAEEERVEREARNALNEALWLRGEEEDRLHKELVSAMLEAKGVRLDIDACGCCDSPWVRIEIDGQLVVDGKENYRLYMIEAAE